MELQAMIAWEDVPRTSSSVGVGAGASAVVLVGKVVDVVGAILVDEADEESESDGDCKTVDIGDRGGSAPASSRSFVRRRELSRSRGSRPRSRAEEGRRGQKTELDMTLDRYDTRYDRASLDWTRLDMDTHGHWTWTYPALVTKQNKAQGCHRWPLEVPVSQFCFNLQPYRLLPRTVWLNRELYCHVNQSTLCYLAHFARSTLLLGMAVWLRMFGAFPAATRRQRRGLCLAQGRLGAFDRYLI